MAPHQPTGCSHFVDRQLRYRTGSHNRLNGTPMRDTHMTVRLLHVPECSRVAVCNDGPLHGVDLPAMQADAVLVQGRWRWHHALLCMQMLLGSSRGSRGAAGRWLHGGVATAGVRQQRQIVTQALTLRRNQGSSVAMAIGCAQPKAFKCMVVHTPPALTTLIPSGCKVQRPGPTSRQHR